MTRPDTGHISIRAVNWVDVCAKDGEFTRKANRCKTSSRIRVSYCVIEVINSVQNATLVVTGVHSLGMFFFFDIQTVTCSLLIETRSSSALTVSQYQSIY